MTMSAGRLQGMMRLMQALQCRASFMIVFPALRALRFGQAHAAGKSFLQTGRSAKSDDSTPPAATATGGGSDDAGVGPTCRHTC